jgi:hypothetical protein
MQLSKCTWNPPPTHTSLPQKQVVLDHALFHGAFLFSSTHKAGLMDELP